MRCDAERSKLAAEDLSVSIGASHSDSPQLRRAIGNRTTLVRASARHNIIVRERVSLVVKVAGVHDARVMVRRRVGVVLRHGLSVRLAGVEEQRGAVERGADAGRDGVELGGRDAGEGARAVAEDVLRRRLVVGAHAAEAELVVGHLAGDGAPLRLRVDAEVGARILGPDLVDVVGPVVLEEGAVSGDAAVGAQSAEVRATVRHDQLAPACTVFGVLSLQVAADEVQPVRRNT